MSGNIGLLAEDFYKHNPQTFHDIVNMGYKLKFLGDGAFRDTYQIRGYNAVVKIPIDADPENIGHAAIEIRTINRINRRKRFKILRQFMPETYYMNQETGIILMKKYNCRRTKASDAVSKVIANLAGEFFRQADDLDIYSYNIGYNEIGDNYVVTDLGCFEDFGA